MRQEFHTPRTSVLRYGLLHHGLLHQRPVPPPWGTRCRRLAHGQSRARDRAGPSQRESGRSPVLTEWLLVGFGVLLTLGTALFVAAEFSIVTLDPGAVDRQTAPDDRRGRSVRKAVLRLSTQLSGAQVGITLTTILVGYTTQPALATLLRVPISTTPLARGAVAGVAGQRSVVVVNVFSMLFGELVPKNMALSRPLAVARAVIPPHRWFTLALRPVIAVLNGSANVLLRRVGVEPREELADRRKSSPRWSGAPPSSARSTSTPRGSSRTPSSWTSCPRWT